MPVEINTFEPDKGPVGWLVRIDGSGFAAPGETKVFFFEDVKGTDTVVRSNEEIQSKVPSGAKKGIIVVKNGNGVGRSAKEFTVATEGVWVISFDPKSGGPGRKINIYGINFSDCKSVMFGNKNAHSFTVVSDDIIEAQVPYDARPSGVKIKVSTPKGAGESPTDFQITQ